MVIYGYSDAETRLGARVIADYKDYSLDGMEAEVSGSLDNIIVGEPTEAEEEKEVIETEAKTEKIKEDVIIVGEQPEEEQVIQEKMSFFTKIIDFFKKLFGLN